MSIDGKKTAEEPDDQPDVKLDVKLYGGWSLLDFSLGIFATLLLSGLIVLTCVDVVARSWFNAPINGAFELTQLMLAGLIFTALPMTTAAGEHIEVELLTQSSGPKLQLFFSALGQLISAVVLFVLSWRLWAHAAKLAHDGAVTNSLELPFSPVGYFAALLCALSGLIALARLVPHTLRPHWQTKQGGR